MKLTNNVTDTALVLEGGGMRGVYTAAVVETLLSEGIFIDYVAGISAGSTNLLNYVSRDPQRGHKMFVDLADDPMFSPWKSWIRGKGFVDTDFDSYGADGVLPFDYEAFMANPAQTRIGAVDADTGESVYWSKDDIDGVEDLMRKKMASSSPPIYMPPVTIGDRAMIDGSFGEGGGIPLAIAQKDGYEKFFVVFTRERSYVKKSNDSSAPLVNLVSRKHPAIARANLRRPIEYNATRERLLELERQGRAYLFFPEHMSVGKLSRNRAKQQMAYDQGLEQARREVPRWKQFLGLCPPDGGEGGADQGLKVGGADLDVEASPAPGDQDSVELES